MLKDLIESHLKREVFFKRKVIILDFNVDNVEIELSKTLRTAINVKLSYSERFFQFIFNADHLGLTFIEH